MYDNPNNSLTDGYRNDGSNNPQSSTVGIGSFCSREKADNKINSGLTTCCNSNWSDLICKDLHDFFRHYIVLSHLKP